MQQLNPGSLQRPARGAWPLPVTSLVHPGTRLCVWGSNSPLSSGAGCCRPGRVCGCPNICGQMPCRISHRNGERRWHGSGRPRSAEAVASLVTVTHRAGGTAGVPQGLLVGAWGCLPAGPPVPCRLFACSQEKEAEAGAFKGFFNPG